MCVVCVCQQYTEKYRTAPVSLKEVSEALNKWLFVLQRVSVETVCVFRWCADSSFGGTVRAEL